VSVRAGGPLVVARAAAAAVVALGGLASVAHAFEPNAVRAAGKAAPAAPAARPLADAYAGYSYTHAGEAGLNGWGLDGSYPLGPRLRLVLDLTGHYGSFAGVSLSQTALMAGARHTWSLHGLGPFAEGLVGFARTSSSFEGLSDAETDWGFALGGGVDYPTSGRWAGRAVVHLRFLRGEGVWDTDPRLSVGAVYRFR
jgi:opacity protein-like surface antigen